MCHSGAVFAFTTDPTDFDLAAIAAFGERTGITGALHFLELAVFAPALQAMAGYVGMIFGHSYSLTVSFRYTKQCALSTSFARFFWGQGSEICRCKVEVWMGKTTALENSRRGTGRDLSRQDNT